MKLRLLLLLATLGIPIVGAGQYHWEATGFEAWHEFPDKTLHKFDTFYISGTVIGSGNTDDVTLNGLVVTGCTVLESSETMVSAVSGHWYARLRLDDRTCSWHRNATVEGDEITGGSRGQIASGAVTSIAGQFYIIVILLLCLFLYALWHGYTLLAIVSSMGAAMQFLLDPPWLLVTIVFLVIVAMWLEYLAGGLGGLRKRMQGRGEEMD